MLEDGLMKALPLDDALAVAEQELGWANPDQKLRFALHFIHMNTGSMWEGDFRSLINRMVRKRRQRRKLDPRGEGSLIIRSREHTGYGPNAFLYWNQFEGWEESVERATLYTLATLKALDIPGEEAIVIIDPIAPSRAEASSSDQR